MNNLVDVRDALAYQYDRIVRTENVVAKLLPYLGDYKMSARTSDFYGWLLCDGRELNRSEHSMLFEVIGTAFGASSDSTFKLPDFRGRVLGQPGNGAGLTERALGSAIGAETHLLNTSEVPSHTHGGTTFSSGEHDHATTTQNAGAHSHAITDPGHVHTQTTINDDFNSSGEDPPGFAADSAGTRTWNNINPSTTGISINSAEAHSHVVTVADAGAHTHTFVTHAAGGGRAHNIMQPTLFGVHVFIYAGSRC